MEMPGDKKTKIIIFGKNGQVGSNLLKIFAQKPQFAVKSYASSDIDFADLPALENFLNNIKEIPDFIINAAAYTNVDKAEDEKELCDKINHQAVVKLASFCADKKIKLIHYSTDYVFNGFGKKPFKASNKDDLRPLNHYGKTKLLAEKAIINSGCDYIIFRISWVYDLDEKHKNFYNTIKRLAKEKEILKIVSDQVGSPTGADFVAVNTIKIIENSPEKYLNKIFHLNNGRFISWYKFAKEIVGSMKKNGESFLVKEIQPIKTSEYVTRAIRPLNSRLEPSFLRLVKFNIVKIFIDKFFNKISRSFEKKFHKFSLKYLKISKKDNLKLQKIFQEFPQVMSLNETLDYVIKGASLCRFGDGEFNIANFLGANNNYQKSSQKLTERLNEVISEPINDKLMICISPLKSPDHYPNWYRNLPYWEYYWLNHWHLVKDMIEYKKYGNALISRDSVFYEIDLPKIKSIWQDREVVFVVGKNGRFVFDQRLFDNIKNSEFIYVKPSHAFEDYDNILEQCLGFSKDKLFFIAAGPTATVLAFDLYKAGYQALDFGHLPNCYAEFLKEKPRPETTNIDNSFV